MVKKFFKVTVFTPTYNRNYTLSRLYESLISQTYTDFEWLILDDGSTDNTEELIDSFRKEKKIDIKYFKQKNGGKHRAINAGVALARGELFFIVDSDDYIVEDAIETIVHIYKGVESDHRFAGVCGLKVNPEMTPLGGEPNFEVLDTDALNIRYKHQIREDLAEVFRTAILKAFVFPEIDGEKFCPESLVWNRIAQNYKLRYTNKKIYVCEFLEDGLSKASIKIRVQSPKYSTMHYKELFHMDIPIIYKIRAGINYWRFAFYRNDSLYNLAKNIGWVSLPLLPIGFILRLKESKL